MKKKLPWFLTNPNPGVYRNEKGLCLDFETTNISNGSAQERNNRLVLAVWDRCLPRTGDRHNLKSCFGSEFEQGRLLAAIREADFLIAHNAKFELQWLKRCGVNIDELLIYDTMVAEKVILGNRVAPLDLDSCCKRRGLRGKSTLVRTLIQSGVSPDEIPVSLLLEYCKQDVAATRELFRLQLSGLSDKLLAVVFTRCLLTPVLADIEDNGMQLDKERVDKEYTKVYLRFQELEKEQTKQTGGINLNSPKQVAEFLYDKLGFEEATKFGKPDRTPAGGRRTDQDVYGVLRAGNKRQKDFLELKKEYSKLNAQLTKYLTKFKECLEDEEAKGLLKAQFHQTRTANHRTSSTGTRFKVQLQNLDRTYKSLFRARDRDSDIVEIDGAQLEFRVGACLGHDEQAIRDIVEDVNIHKFTQKVLQENGQPTDYQGAKEHTFKPMYGGTSGTDAEKTYYEAFKRKYSSLYKTQLGWCEEALRTKKLETSWGMIFYFPDIKVSRSGYINRQHDIFNYPISCLATAEIVPVAIVYLWHSMKQEGYKGLIVNIVHDSAISEIPKNEQERYLELGKECFGAYVYDYLDKVYGLPLERVLGCSVVTGKFWHEGPEQKINIL